MDLTSLSPEQLASLKAQLDSLTDTSGRSPLKPRQLHDLRLLPTKDDPRPTFFWSAEPPRTAVDLTRTTVYPKLLWSTTGQEITVTSAAAEQSFTAQGYQDRPPADLPVPDPMDVLRAQLDALSPQDRELLIAAQQQDRIATLKAKLVALPEDQLAALLQTTEAAKGKKGKVA